MTKIISFCGSNENEKTQLATEIAIHLNKNHTIIFENKIMIKGETIQTRAKISIEKDTFEAKYREILSYLLADVRNRSIAKQNSMDFIIYGDSVYDLASQIELDKSLISSQKNYLTSILSEHGNMFPSDMIVYCEPMEKGIKLLKNGQELRQLKTDQVLMEILGSEGKDFVIAQKDDQFRAKGIMSIISHEFDVKTDEK